MIRLIGCLAIFCTTAVLGGKIPCGKISTPEEYIVGGNDTDIEEVPYQVSLESGISLVCGGSILSPTHILTAAHCVTRGFRGKATYSIRAGSSFGMRGGLLVPVKKVAYHPKFNLDTVDYDVAVLELETPLRFNASMKPVKVADKEPADGEQVKASGWGCKKEDGPLSYRLQSVVVPVVNRTTCKKNYEYLLTITPRMICAGVEGKDACQGDSGGPLVYRDTLVGIVSTGYGCGRKGFPGVYTNVADPEIRKFIKDTAKV